MCSEQVKLNQAKGQGRKRREMKEGGEGREGLEGGGKGCADEKGDVIIQDRARYRLIERRRGWGRAVSEMQGGGRVVESVGRSPLWQRCHLDLTQTHLTRAKAGRA